MSPSVGTSSDLTHHVMHAGRPDHIPAACERASVCCEGWRADRGADCFERGPVPFADFLYHENRKLALEHPRTLPNLAAASTPDSEAVRETAPETAKADAETRNAAQGAIDRKTLRQGAIVMNFSRPTLVARFIDLYA